MGSAYIQQLQKATQETKATNDGSTPAEVKFDTWWKSLHEATRDRPYGFSEIKRATGLVDDRKLGIILVSRGWTRKRKWSGTIHYYRLWVPPCE